MVIAILAGVSNAPTVALAGPQGIALTLIAALVVLVPTGIISAELGSGWPHDGGVYLWVREAFGPRLGFLAVFLQWAMQMINTPTALSGVAAIAAYSFAPSLRSNNWYIFAVIVAIIWAQVWLNMLGVRNVGRYATIGTFLAAFLPSVLVIILAAVFLGRGNAPQATFDLATMIPDFGNIAGLSLLIGAINAFLGIELAAYFIRRLKNPKKSYPMALFVGAIVTVVLLVIVSVGIMVAVPEKNINVLNGIIESISYMFKDFGITWITPIVAALMTVGWLVRGTNTQYAVATGMLAAARYGHLPKAATRVNRKSSPITMLIVQGTVISLIGAVYVIVPNVQQAFYMLFVLAVSIYLVMYLLMYASAIKLRYSQPDVERTIKVPGGMVGMWIVAGGGFAVTVFTLIIGFVPPAQLFPGSGGAITLWLIAGGGLVLFIVLPFIIDRRRGADAETHTMIVQDAAADDELFLDDTSDFETAEVIEEGGDQKSE